MRSPDLVNPRSDILALCYHGVSPTWPARISVTPETLDRQLANLSRRGYRGVTFSEAALGEVEGKCVAITFDDGYSSSLQLARPILDRYEMPGSLFVPTDYIGSGEPMSWPGIEAWLGTDHESELLPIAWQEARELADAGWEIGSHTESHPFLPEVSDQQLERELVGSRRVCEQELGRPCRSIAYPYAEQDARVIGAARNAGYAAGAAYFGHPLETSPLAWPRIGVYLEDSERVFRLKSSPLLRRMRTSRALRRLIDSTKALTRRRGTG